MLDTNRRITYTSYIDTHTKELTHETLYTCNTGIATNHPSQGRSKSYTAAWPYIQTRPSNQRNFGVNDMQEYWQDDTPDWVLEEILEALLEEKNK